MQKTPPRLLDGEGRGLPMALKEIIMVRARGRARAASGTQACRDAAARPAHPPFLVSPSPPCVSAVGGPVLDEAAGWALAAALAARTRPRPGPRRRPGCGGRSFERLPRRESGDRAAAGAPVCGLPRRLRR